MRGSEFQSTDLVPLGGKKKKKKSVHTMPAKQNYGTLHGFFSKFLTIHSYHFYMGDPSGGLAGHFSFLSASYSKKRVCQMVGRDYW